MYTVKCLLQAINPNKATGLLKPVDYSKILGADILSRPLGRNI